MIFIKKRKQENGIVLDVNSLYPSVLHDEKMPFGEPIYFDGKYENDFLYPLYIQTITCSFDLKQGKIPTIQLKNNMYYKPNEYIKSSDGDLETLTLTNIDLEIFFKHYNVRDLQYHGRLEIQGC